MTKKRWSSGEKFQIALEALKGESNDCGDLPRIRGIPKPGSCVEEANAGKWRSAGIWEELRGGESANRP